MENRCCRCQTWKVLIIFMKRLSLMFRFSARNARRWSNLKSILFVLFMSWINFLNACVAYWACLDRKSKQTTKISLNVPIWSSNGLHLLRLLINGKQMHTISSFSYEQLSLYLTESWNRQNAHRAHKLFRYFCIRK